MTKKYWPFEVDETTLDEQARSELDFLKTCSSDDCKSYIFGAGNVGALAQSGRLAEIIFRGVQRWEVVLAEHGEKKSAVVILDFNEGKQIAIDWLNGKEATTTTP